MGLLRKWLALLWRHRVLLQRLSAFCRNILRVFQRCGLFGGDIGLFCRDIGLFYGDYWLFFGDIRFVAQVIGSCFFDVVSEITFGETELSF